MKRLFALMAMLCVANQSLPTEAGEKKAAAIVEMPADAVGKVCEVALDAKGSAGRTTYIGKVVRFDNEKVVLDDVTRRSVSMSSVPVLGSLPYIGGRFRNTGIGVEKVSGEQTIERSRAISIVVRKQQSAQAGILP